MASEIAIPDSAVDPSAYVASLLRTLGNQDPVAIYQETFDRVETITRGLSDGQWLLPLTSHEWSPYQIVGHLVDVDIVYGFRLRLALTSDNPTYPGYDERAWADLPKAPPEGILTGLHALRTLNHALITSIPRSAWKRRGVHGEQGPEDVELMIRKLAGHDLAHIEQLARTVEHAVGVGP